MVKELDPTNAAIASYNREIAERYKCDPLEHAELFILLAKENQGLIVDAGCGPGDTTKYLSTQGLQVEGFDASPEMIAVANSKYRKDNLNFFLGDIRNLSKMYQPHSLRGILFSYSLIHLTNEDVINAIEDSANLLVPGGVLYISYQESPVAEPLLVWDRHPTEDESLPVYAITEGFLKLPFEKSGMLQVLSKDRDFKKNERRLRKRFETRITTHEGIIATLPE